MPAAPKTFKTTFALVLFLAMASPVLHALVAGRQAEAGPVQTPVAARARDAGEPADLRGRDADGNGVRDDVDAFIAQRYGRDADMRSAALSMARALQDVLALDLSQVAHTAPMAEREVALMSCVILSLGPQRRADAEEMIDRIAARTYDTSARFQQREAFRVQASDANFSAGAPCAPTVVTAGLTPG